jgi:hypothetical protein
MLRRRASSTLVTRCFDTVEINAPFYGHIKRTRKVVGAHRQ